ncbi:MAG: TetR/AcrR family transcriptional regulator [Thermodesulfobacteriota bacterium]|nr:TetR/AcrR family transcriptional regulator [Thermodesulfobacteriota bacterium]
MERKTKNNGPKKKRKQNIQKAINVMEGALNVFGEKGYESTTISDICRESKISDATLYEYFSSKEDVLFSIPEIYTKKEFDRMIEVSRYIHGAKEKMRLIIQAYLEFYENNPLYTSVVLLTLKGNKNFTSSPAYEIIRKSSRTVVEAFQQGVEEGVFRDDIDPYIVRNMVMGFIEHLTIQWLLIGRPESISDYRDTIFDMMIRAIEKKDEDDFVEVKLKVDTLQIKKSKGPNGKSKKGM